ncbi:MAG: hypothetical protein CXR31_03835 [Geobacter sp.]|nr:MAG: hypothetical protein CXR31_03835 [Geobacter sp.]
MKALIIILLVAIPLGYAYYNKPLLAAHQEKIYLTATGADAITDEEIYSQPQWDGLEFRDWLIVTATQDKQKQSLVSWGFVGYLKVVDPDWALKAFELKTQDAEGGK